jgi:hypothetical protein
MPHVEVARGVKLDEEKKLVEACVDIVRFLVELPEPKKRV